MLPRTLYTLSLLLLLSGRTGHQQSHGQEFRLNVHGPSLHVGSASESTNPHTYGMGSEVMWTNDSWRFGGLGGVYYNSLWAPTAYLGIAWSYGPQNWLDVGIAVIAATGYDVSACYQMDRGQESCFSFDWARRITPVPMPYVSIGKRLRLRVIGTSTLDGVVLHAGLSVRIQK